MLKNKSLFMILIFALFTLFSCSTNDAITGNSDQNLSKPSNIDDIYSYGTDDIDIILSIAFLIGGPEAHSECLLGIELFAPYLISDDEGDCDHETNKLYNDLYEERESIFEKSYDFRDNYLSKSLKGRKYVDYYRLLSKYSIKNNLINKYYKEHLKITPMTVSFAYKLQHGDNLQELMIDKKYYEPIKNLIKVYRNTSNHREIDNILNDVENDLEKYYNEPKSVIEADFK